MTKITPEGRFLSTASQLLSFGHLPGEYPQPGTGYKTPTRSLSHKRGNAIYIWLVQKIPQTSWAIFILRLKDQLAVLWAKTNKFHADSPAICVPHPGQSAICHRFWAHKAFYSWYDAFFGPKSYGQKGEGRKVHGWERWKYPREDR